MAFSSRPDITDTEHFIAEDQLWAFLTAPQADTLKAASEITGIELLDHISFNRTGYFSFLESGKL